jgi:hypothetical protein
MFLRTLVPCVVMGSVRADRSDNRTTCFGVTGQDLLTHASAAGGCYVGQGVGA